jgi:hypothetical protein
LKRIKEYKQPFVYNRNTSNLNKIRKSCLKSFREQISLIFLLSSYTKQKMQKLLVILLSLSTSLYGWGGSLAEHIEEQCHVVQGEHHEESLADHEEEHHATAGHESHDSENDCEPEHCSDHCGLCHVSATGFVSLTAENSCQRSPLLKEVSSGELEKMASIATRPDTPPPKA